MNPACEERSKISAAGEKGVADPRADLAERLQVSGIPAGAQIQAAPWLAHKKMHHEPELLGKIIAVFEKIMYSIE